MLKSIHQIHDLLQNKFTYIRQSKCIHISDLRLDIFYIAQGIRQKHLKMVYLVNMRYNKNINIQVK